MKTTKQILIEAYELIGDKKRWCQGELARDCDGNDVMARSSNAVAWCSMGAIIKIGGENRHRASSILQDACFDRYETNDVCVNDDEGYAAIRRMFRKAIKAA